MAITLKYCITESDDAKSFGFIEKTGIYDNPLNLGGWDASGINNPSIASALTATITLSQLTDPSTNTYTSPVTVSVYPTLPNVTETAVDLTATQFGYGTDAQFPDAVYQISYAVTSSLGVINTVTQYRGFYAQLDCCIKKLADKVAICTCNCDGLNEKLREIYLYRRLLSAASCCGNISQIFKYIEKITKMCSTLDCGCND